MRYTIDLEEKTITLYDYQKKWKHYLDALHNVYDKKGWAFEHAEEDYNKRKDMVFTGTSGITWSSISTTSSPHTIGTTNKITLSEQWDTDKVMERITTSGIALVDSTTHAKIEEVE